MAEHTLDATITQPYWQRDAPPRLTVDSGDTVIFQCPEPCGQVTPDWTADDIANRWDKSKVHALLGPVDVHGTQAGGSVEVHILDIQHHGWAWSGLIPGFGLLHHLFDEPHIEHWKLIDDQCHLADTGHTVAFQPFCGCIGTAPESTERLDTIPPRANGGNLDLRDATIGSTITLPVFRDGAGICIGDGHAAQGDGEIAGTAAEAPLTIIARLVAAPDTPAACITVHAPTPAIDPRHTLTFTATGVGPDVRTAAQSAAEHMLHYVVSKTRLTAPQALILCSAVCNLRIAQAVNEPNWTVAATIPTYVLHAA